MKLSKKVIKKIGKKGRIHLAFKLGFTEQWIIKLLGTNKENGPLTTALALTVIKEETGLDDQEILAVEAMTTQK